MVVKVKYLGQLGRVVMHVPAPQPVCPDVPGIPNEAWTPMKRSLLHTRQAVSTGMLHVASVPPFAMEHLPLPRVYGHFPWILSVIALVEMIA